MTDEELTPDEQEALKEIQASNARHAGKPREHETWWCSDATASENASATTSADTPDAALGSGAEAVQVSPWGTVRQVVGIPPLIPEAVMECDDIDWNELLQELKRYENLGNRVWQLRQDKLFYFACLYNLKRNCLDWGHPVPQWLDELLEEAPELPPARFPNPAKQVQPTKDAWTSQLGGATNSGSMTLDEEFALEETQSGSREQADFATAEVGSSTESRLPRVSEFSPWGTIRKRIGVPPLIPETVLGCNDMSWPMLLEELGSKCQDASHQRWMHNQSVISFWTYVFNVKRNCLDWGHPVPAWLDELLEDAPELPTAPYPNPNSQAKSTPAAEDSVEEGKTTTQQIVIKVSFGQGPQFSRFIYDEPFTPLQLAERISQVAVAIAKQQFPQSDICLHLTDEYVGSAIYGSPFEELFTIDWHLNSLSLHMLFPYRGEADTFDADKVAKQLLAKTGQEAT